MYDNPTISKITVHKFLGHLWYLSEELVGWPFFNSDISPDVKRAMVTAINEQPGMDDPPKCVQIDENKCKWLGNSRLCNQKQEIVFRTSRPVD